MGYRWIYSVRNNRYYRAVGLYAYNISCVAAGVKFFIDYITIFQYDIVSPYRFLDIVQRHISFSYNRSAVFKDSKIRFASCIVVNSTVHYKGARRLSCTHIEIVSVYSSHYPFVRVLSLISFCLGCDILESPFFRVLILIACYDLCSSLVRINGTNIFHFLPVAVWNICNKFSFRNARRLFPARL